MNELTRYHVQSLAMDAEAEQARAEHALALAEDLDPAWAARPRALVQHAGRPALVVDDPGGSLLVCSMGQSWELTAFLRVAVGLSAAVGGLHARGLVHKDIKPANILTNVTSGEVWLTGFGIASRLTRERQAPDASGAIAGTLEYMAPEQTGRMNRSIDSRSDLYSVGVTLYEMATGELPFKASDAMEWIHCHIARQPVPPVERGIPEPISAIIMRLLAKTAEDRYQTAAGLEFDLRQCLSCWQAHARIDPFRLGQHDFSNKLLIPEKLYGREQELESLLGAFDRVVARGKPELVLVSGYSGIGKSSVVNELHKVLVQPRGLFASGKYDQFTRDIPYATLAQAFQSLVRQILGKSDAEVKAWRNKLADALGKNAQLIVNLIPELELIMGKQAPIPDLPPQDAQSQFQLTLRRFIGVFARKEHPLALFLDDLQWLDRATLDLIEHLAIQAEGGHLLLVGAYRSNEVGPTHALVPKLAAIRKAGANVGELVLKPLGGPDMTRLVCDALHVAPERGEPLARLVQEKTGGNPFFAIQFITALVEQGLVYFEPKASSWQWSIERIFAMGFTDNVIDLLSKKVAHLRAGAQHVLQQFACIGNRASTELLMLVSGLSEPELHAMAWEAVKTGLVHRLEDGYAFLHDRVQEAAYSLIPAGERAAIHLAIGRVWATQGPDAVEDDIFEIVNQLDRGAALMDSAEERERVAELSLRAGKRAKASTAYASALGYLCRGRALLAPDCWERQYPLCMALELAIGECEFLTSDFAAAGLRLSELALRARSLVDRAAVTFLQVTVWGALARHDKAVEVGLEYLRLIGIEWSPHPTSQEVQVEYGHIQERLGSRAIESLVDLPLMVNSDQRATLDALTAVLPAAIFTDENLSCLVLCRVINLSLEHGNCDASCFAYVLLGRWLNSYFQDPRAGYRFGKLAFDLVQRPELNRFQARVSSVFGNCVSPWTIPLRQCVGISRRAWEIAEETGDLTYGSYSGACLITLLLAAGAPLSEVQEEAERALEFATKAKFGLGVDMVTGQLRLIHALRGLTPELSSFNAEEFDETEFEQHLEANPGLVMGTFWYWTRKIEGRFHAWDYTSALAAAEKAATLVWTSASFLELAEYHFYTALAMAAAFWPVEPAARETDDAADSDSTRNANDGLAGGEGHMPAFRAHHRQLEVWAETCPENFAYRAALVGAELARVERRDLEAMHLYEEAIRSAGQRGFTHGEAVAREVAARFYAARGFDTTAHAYREKARAGYLLWGAHGKLRALDRRYPELRPAPAQATHGNGSSTRFENLDLATVVKTSQAVSGQIGLGRLLASLMVIVLEHAGAERGLLIFPRQDQLWIEAEATTGRDAVDVRRRHSLATPSELPMSMLQYVIRSLETVLLDDAQAPNQFSSDPYFARSTSRSVLCVPLVKQAELIGVVYLENKLAPRVFTAARVEVLTLLASQAAISLENASLEEKEALLNEVHHRVKNNLQLISSLLSLQASRIADPAVAELFADSRNRVRSMALVHENLYRAGNFSRIPMSTHIQSLCAHLTRAYATRSGQVEIQIDAGELELEMGRAVTCGLIINELVSNALKHAFPDGRRGRIRIQLEAPEGTRYVLRIEDDGIGLPPALDFGRVDSLGLQLVHDLTEQLDGALSVSRDSGTTFIIGFDEPGYELGQE